jgi:hypothetical protein
LPRSGGAQAEFWFQHTDCASRHFFPHFVLSVMLMTLSSQTGHFLSVNGDLAWNGWYFFFFFLGWQVRTSVSVNVVQIAHDEQLGLFSRVCSCEKKKKKKKVTNRTLF